MPSTDEIGAGYGSDFVRGGVDFTPATRPDVPVEPLHCHIKVVCQDCGTLVAHVRVERNRVYYGVEAKVCPECLIGMSLKQQITEVKNENKERNH